MRLLPLMIVGVSLLVGAVIYFDRSTDAEVQEEYEGPRQIAGYIAVDPREGAGYTLECLADASVATANGTIVRITEDISNDAGAEIGDEVLGIVRDEPRDGVEGPTPNPAAWEGPIWKDDSGLHAGCAPESPKHFADEG